MKFTTYALFAALLIGPFVAVTQVQAKSVKWYCIESPVGSGSYTCYPSTSRP